MNWAEYARVSAAFRERVGGTPPSILTGDGALDYMKRVLSERSSPPRQNDEAHERREDRRRQ